MTLFPSRWPGRRGSRRGGRAGRPDHCPGLGRALLRWRGERGRRLPRARRWCPEELRPQRREQVVGPGLRGGGVPPVLRTASTWFRVPGQREVDLQDPCVNTSPDNAYWGLFWSNGTSGKWTYATTGVSGLSVPKGGFVAFSWQNGGAAEPARRRPCEQAAHAHPEADQGAPQGVERQCRWQRWGRVEAHQGSRAEPRPRRPPRVPRRLRAPRPAPQRRRRPAARAKARVKASASARPSPSVSESVSPPTADDSNAEATKKTSGEFTPAEQDSGLPVWVPIVVLLGLGGAAGGAVWWRRRTGAA